MVLMRWMLMWWFGSARAWVCGVCRSIGVGVVVLGSGRRIRRGIFIFRGRAVIVRLSELEGRFFVHVRGCSIHIRIAIAIRYWRFSLRSRRPQRMASRGHGTSGANALPPREMVIVKRRRMYRVCIRIRNVHPVGTRLSICITPLHIHCSHIRIIRITLVQMMRVHIRIRPPMARPTARMVHRWVLLCRWRVLYVSSSRRRWRSHVAARRGGCGRCCVYC